MLKRAEGEAPWRSAIAMGSGVLSTGVAAGCGRPVFDVDRVFGTGAGCRRAGDQVRCVLPAVRQTSC